jgi:KipI family sensor histidine kinase inhibitor
MTDGPRIVPLGDAALLIEYEEKIDRGINERCIAAADALEASAVPGVRDVVPAYRSVAVYFDPLKTDRSLLRRTIEHAVDARPPAEPARRGLIRVPVCYGGDDGPDLADVAAFARTTVEEVVARHTAGVYRVFMLGFSPGFAYMGTVDELIAAPRRATPRTKVPAGSVGIAGQQTGIYPLETPGGWQLIGRTPLGIFDASRTPPALLHAGDTVQFFAIDRAEWDRYA